ncbi:MAG: thioredoxin [Solirubrobacterales bacterium]|nr:thioredoxin [Solirubrobacterales bacterium]MCB0864006.1 thioredoxin [Solirubrobacterales bacterium]
MVKDVDEASFQQEVIERSKEVPVVVDFWAEWCGPCRTLGPAIEQAVSERAGKVELAKVDVDSNQQLAAAFRVQGIPAVKAFVNGEMVDEFTGALPPAQISAFLDRIAPAEQKSEEELAEERAKELESNEFYIAGREAREALEASENPPTEAFKAWDDGDHEFAFDLLQKEVEVADPDRRDLLRKVMVGYFTELGPESELAATHRRRLAAVLS